MATLPEQLAMKSLRVLSEPTLIPKVRRQGMLFLNNSAFSKETRPSGGWEDVIRRDFKFFLCVYYGLAEIKGMHKEHSDASCDGY